MKAPTESAAARAVRMHADEEDVRMVMCGGITRGYYETTDGERGRNGEASWRMESDDGIVFVRARSVGDSPSQRNSSIKTKKQHVS